MTSHHNPSPTTTTAGSGTGTACCGRPAARVIGGRGPAPARVIVAATVRAVMTTGRALALLGLSGILLAGCAQPGQLGSGPPDPVPIPVAPALPAPPAPTAPAAPPGPVLIGSGRVEERVQIRTPGPAVVSVHTDVLRPGASTGWHRHPGTETTIVSSGSVTVLREDDCEGTRYSPGDALFVVDAEPHLARNDGAVPAELVVTSLLAPGAPGRESVPAAC